MESVLFHHRERLTDPSCHWVWGLSWTQVGEHIWQHPFSAASLRGDREHSLAVELSDCKMKFSERGDTPV